MPVCTLKELVAKIRPLVHVGYEDTHLTWLMKAAGDLSGFFTAVLKKES